MRIHIFIFKMVYTYFIYGRVIKRLLLFYFSSTQFKQNRILFSCYSHVKLEIDGNAPLWGYNLN